MKAPLFERPLARNCDPMFEILVCDSFCDCQMLRLAGSYDPAKTYLSIFGVLLCLDSYTAEFLPNCLDLRKYQKGGKYKIKFAS